MPRSVAEIQADIDRVKAQIAYNQKYSQGFAQPSTKVGWNSYIINNDRGLLDAYQARENAWKQQMAQQEASRLAQMNDKLDEYNLNYQKAMSMRNYAQQAFDMDRSDDPAVKATLQRNLDEANATVAYWGKKLGKNTEPTVPKQEAKEEEPKEVVTQEDQVQIAESASTAKEWTDAAKKKAIEAANKVKDSGKRTKLLQDINNRGQTKEESANAHAKLKNDAQASLDANVPKGLTGNYKPGALAKWKKENPEYAKVLGL